jgi:hypothetical protein
MIWATAKRGKLTWMSLNPASLAKWQISVPPRYSAGGILVFAESGRADSSVDFRWSFIFEDLERYL